MHACGPARLAARPPSGRIPRICARRPAWHLACCTLSADGKNREEPGHGTHCHAHAHPRSMDDDTCRGGGARASRRPGRRRPQLDPHSRRPGVEPGLAKQHLTAARNALSDVTQLPAAAQLTGEARTAGAAADQRLQRVDHDRRGLARVRTQRSNRTSQRCSDPTRRRPPRARPARSERAALGRHAIDPAIRAKLVEFRARSRAVRVSPRARQRARRPAPAAPPPAPPPTPTPAPTPAPPTRAVADRRQAGLAARDGRRD